MPSFPFMVLDSQGRQFTCIVAGGFFPQTEGCVGSPSMPGVVATHPKQAGAWQTVLFYTPSCSCL